MHRFEASDVALAQREPSHAREAQQGLMVVCQGIEFICRRRWYFACSSCSLFGIKPDQNNLNLEKIYENKELEEADTGKRDVENPECDRPGGRSEWRRHSSVYRPRWRHYRHPLRRASKIGRCGRTDRPTGFAPRSRLRSPPQLGNHIRFFAAGEAAFPGLIAFQIEANLDLGARVNVLEV